MEKIETVSNSVKLSTHFTVEEATRSHVASRFGIDNALPQVYFSNAEYVAQTILEPCRDRFGVPFSPSSFYRSPELCVRIGSSIKSQHTKGEAVDFTIPGVSNKELVEWIAESLSFDQLILEYYTEANTGWVHCSATRVGNRGQVLVYDGKQYSIYS